MKWRPLVIVAVLLLLLGVEGFLAWLFLRIGLGQSDQVASVLSLLLAVITATATVIGALRHRDRGTNADATPMPAQLEATTRYFTGRAAEVARLDRQRRRSATTPAVVLICGTAGVGKTALAMHWAHRSRAHFPDGELHVNLQGYHPDQAVPPREALAVFLAGLGVAGPSIPEGLDERTAQYRTLVAGRRMLVVLDNAASAERRVEEAIEHHQRTIDTLTRLKDRTLLVGALWEHADSLRDLGSRPPGTGTSRPSISPGSWVIPAVAR